MPCRVFEFASPKQASSPALSFPLTFRGRRQVVAFADELFGVSDSSRGSCHLQRWRGQTVKCAKRAVGAPGGERGLGLSDGIARAPSGLCHASACNTAPVAHPVSPMTADRGPGAPERAAPAPFCAPVLTPVATPGPWRHRHPDSSRADHGIALMPLPTTSSQHQAPDEDLGQPPEGRTSCTSGAPGAIDATLQSCQTAPAAGDEPGESVLQSAAALAALAAPPASLGTAADLSLAPSSNNADDGSGGMGGESNMQSLAPLRRAPSEGVNGVSSDLVDCHDLCKRTTSRANGVQETLKSNALRVRR